MQLFVKTGTRYHEATTGQVIAGALAELHRIGRGDVAARLVIGLLEQVGYVPPEGGDIPEGMELPPAVLEREG
jgi:hypothetical protein